MEAFRPEEENGDLPDYGLRLAQKKSRPAINCGRPARGRKVSLEHSAAASRAVFGALATRFAA